MIVVANKATVEIREIRQNLDLGFAFGQSSGRRVGKYFMEYYINRDGKQDGPHAREVLEALLVQGEISAETLIWGQGMESWLPVSQVLTVPPILDTQRPKNVAPPQRRPYQPDAANSRGYGGVAYGMPLQTATAAVVSLVCGILGMLSLLFFVVTPVMALIAIISGHVARGKVRAAPRQVGGDGMAITGLILGYLSMAISLALIAMAAFVIATGVQQTMEVRGGLKAPIVPEAAP
jgi:hypothetical protein